MTTLIIGGGVVGLSIAYGLLKRGQRVTVIDGSDDDSRASRGNFGLVWIQGKGVGAPHYSDWSRGSARLWPSLAKDLLSETGIDVHLSQIGGVDYFTDEDELETQIKALTELRTQVSGSYPFEVLEHAALKRLVPEIGPKVVGGLYSPMDGHVNPLALLRALAAAVRQRGGTLLTGAQVSQIHPADRAYRVTLENGTHLEGSALILAAGLGSAALGPDLGFATPIRPQQGQVLITEKLPFFLKYPSGRLRQVNEGGVQIGASKAEHGRDDTDLTTLQALAEYAVDVFPMLEHVRLLRSWAALRIMSPDGLPIYQRSPSYDGAVFVTCHSGITLAAAHAGLLPDWISQSNSAPDLSLFSEARFDV